MNKNNNKNFVCGGRRGKETFISGCTTNMHYSRGIDFPYPNPFPCVVQPAALG